jgi:hypothetical protein
MRIRFGRDLDGEHGTLRVDELDAKTTGPLGLLGILETQLGLPHGTFRPSNASWRIGNASSDATIPIVFITRHLRSMIWKRPGRFWTGGTNGTFTDGGRVSQESPANVWQTCRRWRLEAARVSPV